MLELRKYGASWCAPCKQQDKEFEKGALPCPCVIYDIDEMEDEELEKLKIQSVPVTILYEIPEDSEDIVELHRWVGFTKAATIYGYVTTM